MTFYVYVLRCSDNSLYTGITTDYVRRYKEHKAKLGAKYTRSHSVSSMEALWECDSKNKALKLEYAIKTLTKNEKEQLMIEPELLSVYFSTRLDHNEYVYIKNRNL